MKNKVALVTGGASGAACVAELGCDFLRHDVTQGAQCNCDTYQMFELLEKTGMAEP